MDSVFFSVKTQIFETNVEPNQRGSLYFIEHHIKVLIPLGLRCVVVRESAPSSSRNGHSSENSVNYSQSRATVYAGT